MEGSTKHHEGVRSADRGRARHWRIDQCCRVSMQVQANQMIHRLYWSPGTPSQVIIGEILSPGLSPYLSSIISWSSRDLQRLSTPEPSLSAVDRIRRYQLRWCKRSQSEALANLSPRLCAILANHDDPYDHAHATLAVLDPATLHSTPSPESHFCGNQEWVAPSGSHVILCDTSADQMVFRIFVLPSLQEQASLCFPETHPITSSPPWKRQALVTRAPSGCHVAVLWDATYSRDRDSHLGPLTIHDGMTGQLVCSSHPWAGSSERAFYCFVCIWSPTSTTVLVMQQLIHEIPDLRGCCFLFNFDGVFKSCRALHDVYKVTFSPCGSYVHSVSISGVNGHGNIGKILWADDLSFIHDFQVSRHLPAIVWSSDGRAAVLPNSGLLLMPDAVLCSMSSEVFDGPFAISGPKKWFQISLSPCGQLVVGTMSAHKVGAISTTATNFVACANPAGLLYQAQVSRQHQSCKFAAVTGLRASWLLDSIAWHPCPGKHVVYAISDAANSIYLIHAHLRVCRVWSWKDLLAMSRRPFKLRHQAQLGVTSPIKMMWLPDGSRLAITNAEYLVVLTFDPELATIIH